MPGQLVHDLDGNPLNASLDPLKNSDMPRAQVPDSNPTTKAIVRRWSINGTFRMGNQVMKVTNRKLSIDHSRRHSD